MIRNFLSRIKTGQSIQERVVDKINEEFQTLHGDVSMKVDQFLSKHPLYAASHRIDSAIDNIQDKQASLWSRWEEAYSKFSWWQKMTVSAPDLSTFDRALQQLKKLKADLLCKHAEDIQPIYELRSQLVNQANEKLNDSRQQTLDFISCQSTGKQLKIIESADSTPLFNYGLLAAGAGAGVSMAADLSNVSDVYDALRRVNGHFAGMSGPDIWWECLWMKEDSLDGLINLTKGAYFEQQVASQTGGELFENFNHPDTDICIDGIEVQLKATDSIDYINSIDSDVVVMATSEVANQTDAIDSGISNADITEATVNALGGTIFDVSDALISATGFLGVFATIKGVNHTLMQISQDVDKELAVIEGIDIAITGTIKGFVDVGEMVYNVVASRPLVAIGSGIWKVAAGIGRFIRRRV